MASPDSEPPLSPATSSESDSASSLDTPESCSQLEVRSYFIRERNCLLTRAHFEPLYIDYYLHQGDISVQHAPFHDELFKEALAALTLHCASRPWNETIAWTMHFELPLINLFLTGDNNQSSVVGQIFSEDVRSVGQNKMMSDLVRPGHPVSRSAVSFGGRRPFPAVEEFYDQSEQRLGRFFQVAVEDFAFITAQPDCDLPWLRALTTEAVQNLDQTETLSLLEKRNYHWECGCTEERMMRVLLPSMKSDPDDLFGDEPLIRMRCPRCGWRYVITREAMEGFGMA
jgi:molecular chaperone Hsp33